MSLKQSLLKGIFLFALLPGLGAAAPEPGDNVLHTTVFHTQGKTLNLQVAFAIGYGDGHVCIKATGRDFKDTITDAEAVSIGGQEIANEFGPQYNCIQESFKVSGTDEAGSMTYTIFSDGKKYVGAYPPVANINL